MTTQAGSAHADVTSRAEDRDDAPPRSPAVLAYEARRCRICGCRHPGFGFEPPLARQEQELWACGPHRAEVERQLGGGCQKAFTESQMPLL